MRTLAFPMPEYDLSLQEGRDGAMLVMKKRDDKAPAEEVTLPVAI